jgi:dGTPase
MQDYLLHNVYLSGEGVEKDRQGRRLIADLFAAFIADPGLLPDRYGTRIPADGLPRVTCDYIAGMTDRFCAKEHQRVCGGPAAR